MTIIKNDQTDRKNEKPIVRIAIWGLVFDIVFVAIGGIFLVTFSGVLLRDCGPGGCQVLCDSYTTRIVEATFRIIIFSSWISSFMFLLIGSLLLFFRKDLGKKITNIGIWLCFCFGVFLVSESLIINICTDFGRIDYIFRTAIFTIVFYLLTFRYFKQVEKI